MMNSIWIESWMDRGNSGIPAGMPGLFHPDSVVSLSFRWCRFAQPPANGYDPSGIPEGCQRARCIFTVRILSPLQGERF